MAEAKITIVSDTITPTLKQLRAEANTTSKKVLTGMAIALRSWIRRSFNDAEKRIEPWAPKKDGTPSILQSQKKGKSAKLVKSIHVRSVTEKEAELGTDTKYAPYHQFGTRRGLPRRPFFPFSKEGKISQSAEQHLEKVAQAAFKKCLKK